MEKYVCGPCGYIYDPEIGDPDTEFRPAHLLRICRTTGAAPNAASAKTCSIPHKGADSALAGFVTPFTNPAFL